MIYDKPLCENLQAINGSMRKHQKNEQSNIFYKPISLKFKLLFLVLHVNIRYLRCFILDMH